eukprot:m.387416 g.387416  ORF g.387416 m.387416 type:complete len:75 (+) comp161778_c0_seq1:2-226(+)
MRITGSSIYKQTMCKYQERERKQGNMKEMEIKGEIKRGIECLAENGEDISGQATLYTSLRLIGKKDGRNKLMLS